MKLTFTSLGIAVAGWLTYVNQNMPLVYGVIGLALIEILLTIRDENVTMQKLSKGFFAMLLPVIVQALSHGYPDALTATNAALGVMVTVQISAVGPLLVNAVKQGSAWLKKGLPKAEQPLINIAETDALSWLEHMSPEELSAIVQKAQEIYHQQAGGQKQP